MTGLQRKKKIFEKGFKNLNLVVPLSKSPSLKSSIICSSSIISIISLK